MPEQNNAPKREEIRPSQPNHNKSRKSNTSDKTRNDEIFAKDKSPDDLEIYE